MKILLICSLILLSAQAFGQTAPPPPPPGTRSQTHAQREKWDIGDFFISDRKFEDRQRRMEEEREEQAREYREYLRAWEKAEVARQRKEERVAVERARALRYGARTSYNSGGSTFGVQSRNEMRDYANNQAEKLAYANKRTASLQKENESLRKEVKDLKEQVNSLERKVEELIQIIRSSKTDPITNRIQQHISSN